MSIQDIGQYGETSESVIRSLILTALRSRSFVECKMLVYGMDAQHTARGPHAPCRKPGCCTPYTAQNALILAQKWLSCFGNTTMLHFSYAQVGYK